MNTRTASRAPRLLGSIAVTRIVTDFHPLELSPCDHAATIGQLIDEHLARAAQNGAQVQTVTLELEPDFWASAASEVYAGSVDPDYHHNAR